MQLNTGAQPGDCQQHQSMNGNIESIISGGNGTAVRPGNTNLCAGCNQPITEKYLLRAVDRVWHEDCLKCSCCDCRLGEVGSSLFVKANLLLCKQDYLRLFGTPGQCSACLQPIPAFEMVMRAKEHVYHLDCFACQHCKLRFCVGDRFYLYGSRIVCENHSEEKSGDNTTSENPPLSGYHNNNNNYDNYKHHHLNLNIQHNTIESTQNPQQNHGGIVDAVN